MTEIQDRAVAGLSLYCQATPAFAVREKTAREGLGMAYTSQTRQRVRVGRLAGAFKVETAKGDAGSGARFNCRVVALGCSIPCSILTSAVFSSTKTSHDLDSELYSHICFPMLSYPYMQSCLDWPQFRAEPTLCNSNFFPFSPSAVCRGLRVSLEGIGC